MGPVGEEGQEGQDRTAEPRVDLQLWAWHAWVCKMVLGVCVCMCVSVCMKVNGVHVCAPVCEFCVPVCALCDICMWYIYVVCTCKYLYIFLLCKHLCAMWVPSVYVCVIYVCVHKKAPRVPLLM